MKKNVSYREKLLELGRIYKITEIQNYIKRKKNLTTQQIEHILKKNNVPIPKDFNVSFFKRSITNPISKAGKEVSGFYSDTTDDVGKFFKRTKINKRSTKNIQNQTRDKGGLGISGKAQGGEKNMEENIFLKMDS